MSAVLLFTAAAVGFCGGYVTCALSIVERHQAGTTRPRSSGRCAGCGREVAPDRWSINEEAVCADCDH